MKNNKGITLMALALTIIVLLILSGITIVALTGDNGLIGKSGDAKNATERANEKEELEVAVTRLYDKRGNLNATKVVDGLSKDIKSLNTVTATDGKFPVKVEYKNGHKYQITKDGDIMISVNAGDTAPDDANAAYSSGEFTAIIPAGFTVSGTEGETSIENGLVVRDSNQNEWVWIPVSSTDLSKMYESGSTEYTMLGTNVKTTYKSIGTTLGNRTLSRTSPGLTSFKEPDVISIYDTEQTYRTQAGFGDLKDMATKLKNDYKDMIESVKKNGGFYIGRYELGKTTSDNKPQEKAGTVMSGNWYNLYKACKSFSGGNIESRMIWGCQWDQVCRFISSYKNTNNESETRSLDNSKTYGNYSDSQSPANIQVDGNNKYGSRQETGFSEYWKTNNIYDLAGNYWEWTQEVSGNNRRAFRGRFFQS